MSRVHAALQARKPGSPGARRDNGYFRSRRA